MSNYEVLKMNIKDILANMPCNVYWKGKDSVYMGCNKRMADSLGLNSPKDIIGKTDFDFGWDEKAAQSFREFDKSVMEEEVTKSTEDSFTEADGKLVTVLTNKSPMYNDKDEVIGVLAISTDITDRIKQEKEIVEKKNKELESVIKKYRQFIENQEHDVRTPYVGIIGLAELLTEMDLPEEALKYSRHILRASNALLKYNDQMLDALALEQDNASIIQRRFKLASVVDQIFQMNIAAAEEKRLACVCHIDEKIPTYLKSDERILKTILLNLMSNAIRFTSKGRITLSVNLHKQEKNQAYLKFIVEDTGIGIPEDKQYDIYELFYKIKPSNKGGERGHGLGLALVNKYVTLLKGELNLVSKLDVGSRFSVILPLNIAMDQEADELFIG